jgi:shikimate 5-dehydrogenase
LDAFKLNFVAIGEAHRNVIREVATEQEPMSQAAESVDFIARKGGKWHGYNLLSRALFATLEAALRARKAGQAPLKGRSVLLIGTTGQVNVLARLVKQAGGTPILTSPDEYGGSQLAQALGCSFVALSAVSKTPHDVLIVGDASCWQSGLEAEHLQPGTTVLDLTALPRKSPLLLTAQESGCHVVAPSQVLVEQVMRQAKTISGQDVPREPLAKLLGTLLEE